VLIWISTGAALESKGQLPHQVARIVGGGLYQVNTIKIDFDYFQV
jgi:hypothetical protein